MKKLLFLSLGLILFLGACKKDDDNGGGSVSDKLKNGKWKLVASTSVIEVPGAGTQTFDLYALLEACEKDNFSIFQDGGVILADEGPSKCNSSDPQESTGTWALAQNDTRILINGGGLSVDAEILEITSSKLVIKYFTDFGGLPAETETELMNF